ncbi:alcohol-forming fatty acyl-CoA reductase [Sarotherodon galilaeus]
MFCPFCGISFSLFTRFCASCGRSLELLRDTDQAEGSDSPGTSKQPENSEQQQTCPSYKQFMEYKKSKSKEREAFSCGAKLKLKQQSKPVKINIGIMVSQQTDLKLLKGKTLPLFISPKITAPDLLKQAVEKMRTFNKDLVEGSYVLLYPNCTEVINVPGTERPFRLADYKEEIGKNYNRISLFICPESHFKQEDGTSDSDPEIVITSRSTAEFNQADTLVFKPQDQSTPNGKHAEKE